MEWYYNRVVPEGTLVFVYYNLHKHMFSIKALEGEFRGKIVLHSHIVFLTNGCRFYVSKCGQKRVRKEKKKNVHAGVIGHLTFREIIHCETAVTYNPYKYETFIHVDGGHEIETADNVKLVNKMVYL